MSKHHEGITAAIKYRTGKGKATEILFREFLITGDDAYGPAVSSLAAGGPVLLRIKAPIN
jgi:hypothetical protein